METTTIQIDLKVRKKLDGLKVYSGEPLNSVIERLANMAFDEEPLSDKDIEDIKIALDEARKGNTYSTKELRKKIGLK